MFRKLSSAIILLMIILISTNDVTAQKMMPIRYKGCLPGANSDIRGNYDILVSIYAVKGGETVVWSEIHPNVKIVNGCFEVPLGVKRKNLRTVLRSQNEFYVEVKLVRENLRFPRSTISSSDIQKALSSNLLSSSDDAPMAMTTTPNLPAIGRWICPMVKFGGDSKDFVSVSVVNYSNTESSEVALIIYKSNGDEAGSFPLEIDAKSRGYWTVDADDFDATFNGYAIISSDNPNLYPAGYIFYQEFYKHIYAPGEETLSYHWEDNAIFPLTWHRIGY